MNNHISEWDKVEVFKFQKQNLFKTESGKNSELANKESIMSISNENFPIQKQKQPHRTSLTG